MAPLIALILCAMLGNVESLNFKDRIIKTFPGKADSKFSNLAVDKNHGWVFIGDVNRLYQLNENLESVVEYKTGQKVDSLHCPMPNIKCYDTRKKTNNYNKALVVDYSTTNTRLISCGSVFQGLCEVHNDINNISKDVRAVFQPVAANDENSSTIAFIGPGPMDLSFSSLVLYVGATNTDNSIYRKEVPVIASRSLGKRNLLHFANYGTKMISAVPKYTINYIFGFSSGLFTYFLTSQMKSVESSSIVSKLIRICNEDDRYSSYTEIQIECTGNDGRNYNLAQAAFKTRLDSKFAKLLGLDISLDVDVLFVIFSQSEKIEGDGIGKPSKYSALCVYSLKATDRKFVENIKMCSEAGIYRHPEHIAPGKKFKIDMPNNIDDEDFCRIEFHTDDGIIIDDTQLQGIMPLRSEPLFTSNTLPLTAIAAAPIDNEGLVVYLGTGEGYLKKIVFENSTYPREIRDIFISGSSVNPHMQFDSRVNHLYAMTKNKLAKIKIHESDEHEKDVSFDCTRYTSCTACVSSRFRCNWCLTKHQCIYNEDKNAEYNSVLSSPSCNNRRGNIGFKYCPAVVSYGNGRKDVLIAAGTKKSIEFKTSMSAQFWKNKKFLCNFTIEGRIITRSAAFLNSGVIRCDTTEFTYSQHKPNLIVSFDVLWDNWKVLDHHNNMELALYKCSVASNCKTCLTLRNEYKCGWCGDKCQTFDGCRNSLYNWWGQSHHTCSAPSVTHFEPQYGWWHVQNNITIKGINLCSTNDNVCNITVAGAPCIPMEHSPNYNPPTRIVCQINKIHKLLENKNNPGPVLVQMGQYSAKSIQNFTIIELDIVNISPRRGPQSGGTELTLKGNFTDIENFIGVFIENITCRVFSRNSCEIKCYTGASKQEMSGDVDIKVNMNNKLLIHRTKGVFNYFLDPIVENFVFDTDNLDQAPKSIPAGGIELYMQGTNFTIIQKPLFYIYSENMTKRYITKCNVSNHSMMSCLTPLIPDISSSFINPNNPIRLNYGFKMDDVIEVQNISMKNLTRFEMLMLYPNPTFKTSPNEEIKTTPIGNGTFLLIEGENINYVFRKRDIIVKVGNRDCEVEHVSAVLLTCRLFQPTITNWLERITDDPQDIIVHMGQLFQANVGKLAKDSSNLMMYILYSSGVILIITALGILLTVAYKKFSTKTLKMQQQINRMGMEAITMRQCIKQIVVEKQIHVDGSVANILKLPNITIEYMPVSEANIETPSETEYLLPLDRKWEFLRENLVLGGCLGEGEFGKVVQGEALGIIDENITTTVAIKMLKDVHKDTDMIDLVSEMEILKLIGTHTNVLRILGCCSQNGPLLIITEYAVHGNLRDFLRKHLPSANDEITPTKLPQRTSFTFALQVAKGMEYLASLKCVHRDLAARNILVSENYVLKIADFGLARDIRNKEYYRKTTGGRVPIKWMAPEALHHSLYTTPSDVWSYGILLWEISTLGGVPYPLFTDMEKLVQALDSGYRMMKPKDCCMKMYSIMRECWNYLPEERPTFSAIVKNLEQILSSNDDDEILDEADSHELYDVDTKDEFNEAVEEDYLLE